jgi:predicted transcriptional regulator
MTEDQAQVSAYISATTKRRLDEFARETGLKKGYILEQALDGYLSSAVRRQASGVAWCTGLRSGLHRSAGKSLSPRQKDRARQAVKLHSCYTCLRRATRARRMAT